MTGKCRLALGGLLAAAIVAAQRPSIAEPPASAPAAPDATVTITMPLVESPLPPGPKSEVAAAACTLCHTTRYITMQPPFPQKTWEAEVEKMRKVFGAPVTDAQAKDVVEYLVAVRGK